MRVVLVVLMATVATSSVAHARSNFAEQICHEIQSTPECAKSPHPIPALDHPIYLLEKKRKYCEIYVENGRHDHVSAKFAKNGLFTQLANSSTENETYSCEDLPTMCQYLVDEITTYIHNAQKKNKDSGDANVAQCYLNFINRFRAELKN